MPMHAEDLALSFLLLPESRKLYDEVAMVRPIPDLYHYITAAGLEGILKTSSLWATEARWLNDTDELTYAGRLIRETLLAEVPKIHVDYRAWLTAAAERIVGEVVSSQRFFIASLCERRDLLSQWRGYAAAGHCMRFSSSTFLGVPDVHVVRVIYDADEQRRTIRETLRIHLVALERARDTGLQQPINNVSGNFGAQLSLYATAFTNPAFFEEREWRLVTGDAAYPVLHRGPNNVVPYVELPLPYDRITRRVPIKKIFAAPQTAPASFAHARDVLIRCGYSADLLERSSIPLRA
jgi:hypothetical protein